MKKNIYRSFSSITMLVILCFFITSCNEDETLERTGKPTLRLLSNSVTVSEGNNVSTGGNTVSMDFELTYPISAPSQVRIEVVGGTAVEGEDYSFNLGTVNDQGGGFFGGDGYYAEIPAYLTTYTLSDLITVSQDNDPEPSETIQLRLFSVGKGEALVDETFTVNINPSECTYTWALTVTDAYGDGWNGGFISVDIDGTVTNYSTQDLDGTVNVAETQNLTFDIPEGANYTIAYNAAAGGGGAPGWESENTYTLTAPDGTNYSDGPTPTDGVITQGTFTCN